MGVAGEKGVQCVRATDRYKIRTASLSRSRELGGGGRAGGGKQGAEDPRLWCLTVWARIQAVCEFR